MPPSSVSARRERSRNLGRATRRHPVRGTVRVARSAERHRFAAENSKIDPMANARPKGRSAPVTYTGSAAPHTTEPTHEAVRSRADQKRPPRPRRPPLSSSPKSLARPPRSRPLRSRPPPSRSRGGPAPSRRPSRSPGRGGPLPGRGGPPPGRSPPKLRGGPKSRGPPGPRERCCACASFTRMVRPSRSLPSSSVIARSAAAGSANVTNPKPRERPLSRSLMIFASDTSPKRAKASFSRSSVVPHDSPPTNSFFDISLLL